MNDMRCEPPPELRGVDGWHEIERPSGGRFIAEWKPQPERRCKGCWASLVGVIDADTAYGMYGWRYLAPVATPAEVDALRAALKQIEGGFVPGGGNMVMAGDWHSFTNALQAIARAALSAETP